MTCDVRRDFPFLLTQGSSPIILVLVGREVLSVVESEKYISVVRMENTSSATIDWERKYAEDMEKKDEELKTYRYRVLGVSELAKQLEEKKEQSEVMKQKISRLEIALVRVENRASSLEKKLNSVPAADGKTSATAHIPGPSKQILDTLLAENNKLKTALNNLTNKGHSGYVIAVRIDQLEDVIECQKQQITELKAQITSFTSNSTADDGASTGGDVKALQLQVQKLTKSVKMKDEFCSILSSELKKAQEQLQVAKETLKQQGDQLDGTSAESGFVSGGSSEHSAVQETSPEAQDWQRKCEMLQQQFDEQKQMYRSKEQRLVKLVSDKQDLVTRESLGKKEALESCANLKQKVEELLRQLSTRVNSSNYDGVVKERTELQRQLEMQQHDMETLHTEKAQLLTENKKLQDSLTDYKSAIGGGAEQPHLQHQLAQLQRELEAVKLEAESVRVERDELKDQNDEYMDTITFLQDRLKQGEADKRTLETRVKSLDLNVRDLNGQLIRMGMTRVPTHPQTTRENIVLRHATYMQAEAVRDGGHRDPTNQSDHMGHCGPNSVESVRRQVGVARAPPGSRVMPTGTYYGGQQPPPPQSHWNHPSYPANHNPAGGMYPNPAHHGHPQQYMQRYRSYPSGDQYPPDQPN